MFKFTGCVDVRFFQIRRKIGKHMYVKVRKIFSLTMNNVRGNSAHNIMLNSELMVTILSVRLA